MRKEIFEKVKEIIIKETEIEVEITEESNLFDDLELSSLEIFTIFSELEEIFNKKVEEKEISTISTVGDIIDLFL